MTENWTFGGALYLEPAENYANEINSSGTDMWMDETDCVEIQYISGIISRQTFRGLIEFFTNYSHLHGYVSVAVCLFGILSNSANIIVLTRKSMASSTNTLLLWLAVADLLTMLDYLPFAIHFYITEPSELEIPIFRTKKYFWICVFIFHASLGIVFHTVAIWLTVALALFRYIYICKPTKGRHYCSQQRACFVIVLVILLTVILSIPNFVGFTYKYFPGSNTLQNVTNDTSSSPKTSSDSYYYPVNRMETNTFRLTYLVNFWIQSILFKLVPCFMLAILTLLLIHAIHKAYQKRLKLKFQGRREESDRQGEHIRTTGMLLAVLFLFTLTELPSEILLLMNIFVDCFDVYYKLVDFMDFMALFNNPVNFILYCTMSKKFRTTFVTIFCLPLSSWPKWLNMGLIRSQHRNKTSNEVVDDCAYNIQVSCNDSILSNAEANRFSPESCQNHHTCQVGLHGNLYGNSGNTGSFLKNDTMSLSMVSAIGTPTHTHEYAPTQCRL